MASIFAAAKQVIVWLGPGDRLTNELCDGAKDGEASVEASTEAAYLI